MFVAASTACFPDLELADALQRLVDLEYTCAEITIGQRGGLLRPEAVAVDPERAAVWCRQSRRLTPAAYFFDVEAPRATYYEWFAATCALAKATKVVTIAIRASELGTPFNEEVERLRDLVAIAKGDGVVVGLMTETGRMTSDPDTVGILCKSVKGLAVTLDPSHFIYNVKNEMSYDSLLDRVCHIRLRDTKREELQVRVGQGLVEYGRLITQLHKVNYQRALCVDLAPLPGVEQNAEMRKMRLLLESLL